MNFINTVLNFTENYQKKKTHLNLHVDIISDVLTMSKQNHVKVYSRHKKIIHRVISLLSLESK